MRGTRRADVTFVPQPGLYLVEAIMRKRLLASVSFVLLGGVPLLAQPVPETAAGPASEPASVVFLTGLSTGASETGPVVGGVVSKGLTSHLTLEGQGAWLDRGSGVTGVTAFGSLVVNLTDPVERVMPFVSVGAGGLLSVGLGVKF